MHDAGKRPKFALIHQGQQSADEVAWLDGHIEGQAKVTRRAKRMSATRVSFWEW
jgi:hypothetical protein